MEEYTRLCKTKGRDRGVQKIKITIVREETSGLVALGWSKLAVQKKQFWLSERKQDLTGMLVDQIRGGAGNQLAQRSGE